LPASSEKKRGVTEALLAIKKGAPPSDAGTFKFSIANRSGNNRTFTSSVASNPSSRDKAKLVCVAAQRSAGADVRNAASPRGTAPRNASAKQANRERLRIRSRRWVLPARNTSLAYFRTLGRARFLRQNRRLGRAYRFSCVFATCA
jgi:hypothetical protein